MNAQTLLEQIRQGNPAHRFARSENAIGIWNTEKGRFQAFVYKTLLGTWERLPVELLVDGQPVPTAWIE